MVLHGSSGSLAHLKLENLTSQSVLGTDASGNVVAGSVSGYSLPTATSLVLGGIKVGGTLTISSGTLNARTYIGASEAALGEVTEGGAGGSGVAGYVPAASASQYLSFLRGDGTWQTPTNTVTRLRQSAGTLTAGDFTFAGSGATTVTYSGGTFTISSTDTDTNTTYTAGTGLTLTGTTFSVTTNTYAAAAHSHAIRDITDLQTALDSKQAAGSYAASSHTHDDRYLKLTETSSFFDRIIDTAPGTLDTLNELAAAIGDDANFSASLARVIAGKADSGHTHSDATTSAAGFMSATDKTKLDGVASNANNYSLPTATDSVLGGIKVGSNLSISSGVLSATDTNTVTSVGISGDLSTGNIELRGSGATTISKSGGTITISSTDTDTNTTYSAGTGLTLTGTTFSVASGTYAASSHTHGIDSVTDAARWWNNFGDGHGTRTSFDVSAPSYGFGWRYIQGSTNGPGTGGSQFYSLYVGLGNDYPSTGAGSYGMYLAIDRNQTNPYLSVRFNENNGLSSWRRINAGYADSAGAVAWDNVSSKPSTFSPSSHTHTIGNVTGLQTALDGKQASGDYSVSGHTHSIRDVTDLQTTLDGKQASGNYAASSHTHDDRYFFDYGFTTGYPGTEANAMPGNRSAFTYSNGAPLTGAIAHFGASGYGIQLNGDYTGDSFSMRSRNGDNATWRPWKRLLTDYNYNSYSPTLTGTGASGTWGISITGNANTATSATSAGSATTAGSVDGLTINNSGAPINPDNVTQNQIGYNTSVSLFGQSDGGLYSSAYSSAWIHQIYGDFRTGQIAIRGKNSGTWQGWRIVVDDKNISSYAVPYGNMTSSTGLNDNKLYLRTNGDNNHYIWNAADDWEEIVAYSGTGLRIASSTGVTLATFTTSGNSMNITGNAATATNVAYSGLTGTVPTWNQDTTGNASKLNPLSGDSNYKLAYTADGARNNAGEWGRAVMFYVPNGQTYGIRVDRADLADTATNSNYINSTRDTPGNALQYWQAPGLGLDEAPSGDWHNTIRMGHGSPLSYYSNTLAVRMTGTGVGDIYTQTIMNGVRQGWKKHWNDSNLTNLNQLTNGPGYITGISYDNVSDKPSTFTPSAHTHAIRDITDLQTTLDGKQASLGFTPYNATNPSGFITGLSFANVSSKPTTLSGYGITDAVTTSQTVFSDLKINFPSGAGGGHSFASNHYSMGLDSGNGGWDHPHYRDLIIGYHTGIRIGANYSGVRFYSDSPTTDANNDGNGDRGENLLMTVGGYAGTANHTDVVVNNNLIALSSLRAPIFYDSNDTSYYLNPAGGSRLRNLYVGDSGDDWSDPGGWGTQVRFSNGPHVKFVLHARTPGIEAGMYVHTPSSVYIGSYTAHSVNMMVGGNSRLLIEDGRVYSHVYMEAAGSVRAPIFYDSNDTAFYLDPNSTSNLSRLIVNDASSGAALLVGTSNTSRIVSDNARKAVVINASLYPALHLNAYDGENTTHGPYIVMSGTLRSGGYRIWTMGIAATDPGTFSIGYSDEQDGNGHYGIGDSWSGSDRHHGRLIVDTSGNTKIRGMLYVNGTSGGITTGNAVIHAGNIGSQSVNYAASAGNADTVDGYHATNAAGGIAVINANGYWYPPSWINVGSAGIYSGTNNAHFRPNTSSYGSWEIIGSKNGWSGIFFSDSSNTLMANGDESGFYRIGDGWQFRWYRGEFYISPGGAGGGTERIALHAGNYSSYALPLSGGTVTGETSFTKSTYPVFIYSYGNTAAVSAQGLQVYSSGGNGAIMAFHRGGYYAVNMGLDSDNVIRIGGWSASANRMQLDMSGNVTFAGNVTGYSDARIKTDVKTIDNALEKVKQLRGVSFTRTDSDDRSTNIGVIAQEVLEIVPEVVSQDASGMYNVAYGNMAGLFIEAIKQQQSLIEQQQKQIDELKTLVNGLTK